MPNGAHNVFTHTHTPTHHGAVLVAAIAPLVCVAGVSADRTAVTEFMSPSSMRVVDANNDCMITDIDYAIVIDAKLIQLYGTDLAVGDIDGDGLETAEDVIAAIADIISASFGKTTENDEPISTLDVEEATDRVIEQSSDSDINLDGSSDVDDVLVPASRIGEGVSAVDVDWAARELFEYIGAIHEYGVEQFICLSCAAEAHTEGISSSWPPDHPDWWKPNHLTGVSNYQPYWPPDHDYLESQQEPNPPVHQSNVSGNWPPNHFQSSSQTWDPPYQPHGYWVSMVGSDPPDTPYHSSSLSSAWPPGHTAAASDTWHHNEETSAQLHHDLVVSRGWWPHHTRSNSQSHTWPPAHAEDVSNSWYHQVELSQHHWPPNHYPDVSNTWGNPQQHQTGLSISYPPGHSGPASTSWPGPQPTWPPGHFASVSQSWSEPTPGSWPIFPPDHSWYTTIIQTAPLAPFPWPSSE